MSVLDNILPPGLREYLHIDYRRIDSYFEQISDPIKYDKVPVWKIGMKLTGPSAEGSQVRPGRSYTIQEKIDAILKHLHEKQLLGGKNEGAFNLEKRLATQILIPAKKRGLGKPSLIRVWISLGNKLSLEKGNQGSLNNLILLEDHPVSDDSPWYCAASAYTALLLLGQEIQEAGYKELAAPLSNPRTSLDTEEKFAHDPIGFLERLSGRLGSKRLVLALYRVRTSLGQVRRVLNSDFKADWVVGYSIFIAAT